MRACLDRLSRPRGGLSPVPVRAHAAIAMPGGGVWPPPVPLDTPLIITPPVVTPAQRICFKGQRALPEEFVDSCAG